MSVHSLVLNSESLFLSYDIVFIPQNYIKKEVTRGGIGFRVTNSLNFFAIFNDFVFFFLNFENHQQNDQRISYNSELEKN